MLRVTERAIVSLSRWEIRLQKPVSFLVMPAFALLNTGIDFSGATSWTSNLGLEIGPGLLLGKPLGIVLGAWIGTRLGFADLPELLTWRQVAGVGLFGGGIGFTRPLFIAALSFGDEPVLLEIAKQSIIATLLLGGLLGCAWLRWACAAGK